MSIAFVHTADWQLGRPFRAFDDRLGGLLEEARLAVIETIAGVARGAGAYHVLVAGDVFDAETLSRQKLWPAIERMARNPDIAWHLLPGNHDPARPGGLWHRLHGYGLPPNVRPQIEPAALEIEPGVILVTAPLTAKGRSSDPTAWMDGVATPAGALRIGLAHGSIYDFTGTVDGSGGTIDPARARKAGLTYLALGDWHGTKRIAADTWYAGTPEPDRYGDLTSGQVLIVRAVAGQPASVEAHRTGHYIWASQDATVTTLTDLEMIEAALVALAPSTDRLLARLALSGALPAEDRAGLKAWEERLQSRLRHLALDASGIVTRAEPADVARLFADPRLAAVAEQLRVMATDGDPQQRRTADRALVRLVEIVRAGPGEVRQ